MSILSRQSSGRAIFEILAQKPWRTGYFMWRLPPESLIEIVCEKQRGLLVDWSLKTEIEGAYNGCGRSNSSVLSTFSILSADRVQDSGVFPEAKTFWSPGTSRWDFWHWVLSCPRRSRSRSRHAENRPQYDASTRCRREFAHLYFDAFQGPWGIGQCQVYPGLHQQDMHPNWPIF